MTADFIKIVSEKLNIHPEPISEETATVELNMGELFKIATEFASQKDASKELEILKSIKSTFTVQSDNSISCNGYKQLCQIIKNKELRTPPND